MFPRRAVGSRLWTATANPKNKNYEKIIVNSGARCHGCGLSHRSQSQHRRIGDGYSDVVQQPGYFAECCQPRLRRQLIEQYELQFKFEPEPVIDPVRCGPGEGLADLKFRGSLAAWRQIRNADGLSNFVARPRVPLSGLIATDLDMVRRRTRVVGQVLGVVKSYVTGK